MPLSVNFPYTKGLLLRHGSGTDAFQNKTLDRNIKVFIKEEHDRGVTGTELIKAQGLESNH